MPRRDAPATSRSLNLAVSIPETILRNQCLEPYRSRPTERISEKPESSMVMHLAPLTSARSSSWVIAWRRCLTSTAKIRPVGFGSTSGGAGRSLDAGAT